MSASQVLDKVLGLVKGGIVMLGVILIVYGAVQFGLAIREGQGGGAQISQAVAAIIGGVVIAAAGLYFGNIDTSWAH